MKRSRIKPKRNPDTEIPEEVKQEVWNRAGGRCEIVKNGKQCFSKRMLQFHHKKFRSRCFDPNILHSKENIVLSCGPDHDDIQFHSHEPGKEWTKKYRTHRWQEIGETEADR